MAKFNDSSLKEEAFEIIELVSDDFDTLTRAFELIAELCQDRFVDLDLIEEEAFHIH